MILRGHRCESVAAVFFAGKMKRCRVRHSYFPDPSA
jgi:hypothetical protein